MSTLTPHLALSLLVLTLFALPASAEQAASQASRGASVSERGTDDDAPKMPDPAMLEQLRKAKPIERTLPQGPPSNLRRSTPAPKLDLGTVTKKIGGGVTNEPATEEVERALKKQGSPAPLRRSGTPALQGAVDTGPVGPKQRGIFGPDDRVWIRHVTEYPFRAIGQLWITHSDGSQGSCSGTLISGRHVLTAAHCLFDEETGNFAEAVQFFPGINGDHVPYGYYDAAYVTVLSGYMTAQSDTYDYEHVLHDLGIVQLDRNTARLGWLSFGYDDRLPLFVGNIVGYPADMPPSTMWRSSCNIDPVDGNPDLFHTQCDTWPGSSGSSVYDFEAATQSRAIYGVNVAGPPGYHSEVSGLYNTSVRITAPYYCWIQQQIGGRC